MIVVMRPRSIGPDLQFEARSLMEAPERLAKLFGLVVVSLELKTEFTPQGETDYVEARLGNDSRWTVFDAALLQP